LSYSILGEPGVCTKKKMATGAGANGVWEVFAGGDLSFAFGVGAVVQMVVSCLLESFTIRSLLSEETSQGRKERLSHARSSRPPIRRRESLDSPDLM